ncbi:MAG TPA: FUSC family protein [Methylomirabilota bacterium]|nr:FUSC family protein [Methylomirabilota bacterium]
MGRLSLRSPRQATTPPLLEFLRRELAPTPGRLGATLRLTLACTAATVPIMIHHIPHGLVVMIVMYLITKEDTTATLMGSVLSMVAVTVGFALALLAWQVALETAWRLVFLFLFAAAGLWLSRAVVVGALGTAVGIPATLAMMLPDIMPVPDTEAMTEFVLWIWWCVALGLAVNLGVQLLLSPGDPLQLLRRELVTRLRAVAEAARSLAGSVARASRPARASLASLTVAGTSEMLALLKTASLRHRWAREHGPELGALISLVDQLVTAAAALEAAGASAPGSDTRERLERVAEACGTTARAIADTSIPSPDPVHRIHPFVALPGPTLPALAAMEWALREIAVALPRLSGPAPRPPMPRGAEKMSLIRPDAFTNREYVQFAIRGALACLICDVLLVAAAYPGIYTSVITCFVVSLSTVGASTQKGVLRFAGAAVGGAIGIFSLMYILPHVETLAGFWAVFAVGTAVAAWVNFGSPRVSYGGYQVGLAFYKVVLQGWGPVTELTVARDRLVGIAFGLLVIGVLEHFLWPVRASDRRRQRFADALHSLAALARLGARDQNLDDVRRRIVQDLGETQRLIDESKFELQSGELEAFQRRLGDAQTILLVLLSLAYQRRAPEDLLASLPPAARELETAVALNLEGLAASIAGGPPRPAADLDAALVAVERSFESSPRGTQPAAAAFAVERRLDLYRTLVQLVSRLDRGRAGTDLGPEGRRGTLVQ